MLNISCSLTRKQIWERTKTETRRLGWLHARVGMELQFCEKCQGLKRGEKLVKVRQVRVTEVRRERLDAIDQEGVNREGFPEMTPAQFVEMFCRNMKCKPDMVITVIRFEYLD
jgi:hypothetical protein